MFKFSRIVLSLSFLALLTGCATKQNNVELSENFWKNQNQQVTIATTQAPKPQMYKTGNQGGIIGLAVSSAMNNKLEKHLKTVGTAWYQNDLPRSFETRLKERHIKTKLYSNSLNPKDHKNFVATVGSDKLLVISLDAVGVKRRYNGLIPADAPQAYVVLTGQLLDKNNQVLWHYKASASQPIDGEWDQPPNYPNLTQAISVAAQSAQQELLDSFFAG